MSTEKVDISLQSTGSQPDISLGSFDSGFSPPRLPFNTSKTNPLATPVVQQKADYSRRSAGASSYLDDTDGDLLDTPGTSKPRWGGEETPAALRAKRKSGAKGALTLRDQEKVRANSPIYVC